MIVRMPVRQNAGRPERQRYRVWTLLSGRLTTSNLTWVILLLIWVAFGCRQQSLAAVDPSERNVVLIVADDLGLDMGCYGNLAIKTPHLDALAGDGTRFTHAFCTTASCSASRSVILSGLHNHANGQYGHQHVYNKFSSFPELKTLPVRLSEAGYRTGLVGKYHVAPADVYRFQTKIPGNSRNPVAMANNARSFVTKKSDAPFFLYFCTSDPHRGGGIVASDPLKPDRFGNRPQGYPGIESVTYAPDDVIVPPFLPDTPTCRAELAQYYESVSRVDQGVGRLIEVLKEAGKYENTLIIFISDHGIAFPGAKTTVYEPGLNSPCIVRLPGTNQRGLASDAMISWVDITPTILDFAGALPSSKDTKLSLQGRSFLAAIDNPDAEGWDRVFASHTFHEITMYYPMRVVRERRFKLIWNIAHQLPYPFASDLWAAPTWQHQYQEGMDAMYGKRTVGDYIQRPRFELYDLQQDPHETNNLADDPAHRETLERLKADLKKFQRQTHDPWILKWEYE